MQRVRKLAIPKDKRSGNGVITVEIEPDLAEWIFQDWIEVSAVRLAPIHSGRFMLKVRGAEHMRWRARIIPGGGMKLWTPE